MKLPKLAQNPTKLLLACVGLDILMVVLHLLFAQYSSFFNLDVEQNLPTVYQSGKLIVLGTVLLFFSLKHLKKIPFACFSIPLLLVLIFWGFDELFQIHENSYRLFELFWWTHPTQIVEISEKFGYQSSLWILYYLPAFMAFGVWLIHWLGYFKKKQLGTFLAILTVFPLLTVILFAELLSSTQKFNSTFYFFLITIEESVEMILGSLLLAVGAKSLTQKKNYKRSSAGLEA